MKKPTQLTAVAIVAVAMVTVGVLGGVGLDNHFFWDDEATTAIYARNLIQQHKITAYDGKNLVGYSFGGGLGEDLGRELRVPPLPAVWAAVGMIAFGQDTFGGRIMFVVAGVLSLAVMAVWLRRHLGRSFAWYLPAVILALSPAYLLYVRNCRYYALAVMFTLLLWMFWAPGKSRRGGDPLDWRCLPRYAGGAASLAALMSTYYLGAAVAFVSLPLFFIHGRYRQPRQYIMLGVLLLTAVGYGGYILATANPFAASYAGEQWSASGHFGRAAWHLWMFIRDLGPHEFFPWLLAVPLLLPWFMSELKRYRPLAVRGLVLLGLALFYVTLAAAMTPPDMAKGDVAEMRYVVPVIAIGAAMAGVSLVILWRYSLPAAVVVFGLLIFSNVLHLGFFGARLDGERASWPPTLYRYVREITQDHTTGTESLVAVLDELPPGTTVRAWPEFVSYIVYPPMFYVDDLHYCDQLTEQKPIAPELLPLPEYLYRERSLPDVVMVPVPYVGRVMKDLSRRHVDEVYDLRKILPGYWEPTNKPEIMKHFFAEPADDMQRYPKLMLFVREGSQVAAGDRLQSEAADADAFYWLGVQLLRDGTLRSDVLKHFERALQLDPDHEKAHVALGALLASLARRQEARQHYHTALKINPRNAKAHFHLGNMAMEEQGGEQRAVKHFKEALELKPDYVWAHINLGVVLGDLGRFDEAMAHYRLALELDPKAYRAHVQLGYLLQVLGRTEEAIAEYQAALEILPKDSGEAKQVREFIEEAQ